MVLFTVRTVGLLRMVSKVVSTAGTARCNRPVFLYPAVGPHRFGAVCADPVLCVSDLQRVSAGTGKNCLSNP